MAGGKLTSLRKLKPRRRRFVELYCGEARMNGTEAARLAGYSRGSASEEAYRLLRNDQIRQAVAERLDALSMTAEEATVRLTYMGRGSLEPFLVPDGSGFRIDLTSERAKAHLGLLRKLKVTERILVAGEDEVVTERKTEIEIHDAKDANIQLARIRGLYVERHEHSGPEGGPIETHELSDADLLERANHQANRVAALAVSVNGNGNGRHK